MGKLSIVLCGAPLSSRAGDLLAAARAEGWEASLAPTEAAMPWLVGVPFEDPRPGSVDRVRPDAVSVCPMTFNTANKWALGIADTRVHSLLSEVLGSGRPAVAVPMVNTTLWQHPQWENTLATLSKAGVVLVDPGTGQLDVRPVAHGSGERVAAAFDPGWVMTALARASQRR